MAGANQEVEQAQARFAQARAGKQLQLSFSSALSGSNVDVPQPPPAHETFGTIQNSLTVPLPVGRRASAAINQAREQLSAAQATYQGARLDLASQVTTAYFELLRKKALLEDAQETVHTAERELADAQKRNGAGDVPALDVIRAQAPLASSQADESRAETDVSLAEESLNNLLGAPLDDPVEAADIRSLPPQATFTLAEARQLAVLHSPDVQAADATVRANQAALDAARQYRDPSVAFALSDTRSGDVTSFSRDDTLQATVTVPLSDGGLGAGQLHEAQAVLAQAKIAALVARRSAQSAVSAAYLNAASARRQLAAVSTARSVAQTSYEKTAEGYRAGLFPFTDVLSAQSALRQAEIASTQAFYDTAAAEAALSSLVTGTTAGTSP